jgi:NAD(P)-dependent dehydrogenase (short-subunit alcohol dehydrogenase family)
MKLENRVVVITGAGAGIGRAAARRFAEKGAILHLIDIDGAKAESAALECARLGVRTSFHSADCRDPIAVKRVADEIFEREAVVDVLFLNAGVGFGGAIADMTLDDWRWVLDINLYGVIHGIDAFLKRMIAQGPGATSWSPPACSASTRSRRPARTRRANTR